MPARRRAHVVGHDWGAALAWAFAAFVPDHVDHLVALSVGHPSTFRKGGFEQYQKSWYMLLFQFKGIAEQWLSNDDWAHFRAWARHPDADAVIAELEANESLTPALNYYRANIPPESWLRPGRAAAADPGSDDGGVELGRHGADRAADDRTRPRTSPARGATSGSTGPGHWMQLEAPDEVSRLLIDFLPSEG